ncbi:hypothetical protein OQA88_8964 [Cercophora sp. LCS_1]
MAGVAQPMDIVERAASLSLVPVPPKEGKMEAVKMAATVETAAEVFLTFPALNRTLTVSYLFSGVHITTCSTQGTIAITFDDGPYLYTSKLLDILAKYEAKTTFFVNGRNWGNSRDAPYPAILRRMIADGHQIGSHTDNHLDLNAIDSARRRQQMAGVEELTRDLFGYFPTYMRPPFGRCNAACQADMASLGYHVIMWNIDTLDYDNNTPETIQNSLDVFDQEVAANATGKYISLEHDVHRTTVDVLAEHVLKTALGRGYKVTTVGECLGDPVGNWYRNATTGEPVSGDGSGSNPGGEGPGGENPGGETPGGGSPGGGGPTLEVSPDGTCAGTSGGKYTCLGSWAGDCCSEWGWW